MRHCAHTLHMHTCTPAQAHSKCSMQLLSLVLSLVCGVWKWMSSVDNNSDRYIKSTTDNIIALATTVLCMCSTIEY